MRRRGTLAGGMVETLKIAWLQIQTANRIIRDGFALHVLEESESNSAVRYAHILKMQKRQLLRYSCKTAATKRGRKVLRGHKSKY